jgi:hypothetical protein
MRKIKSNSQNVLHFNIPYMTGRIAYSAQQKSTTFQSHCDVPTVSATMILIPEHSEKDIEEPLRGEYMSRNIGAKLKLKMARFTLAHARGNTRA